MYPFLMYVKRWWYDDDDDDDDDNNSNNNRTLYGQDALFTTK